KACSNGSSRVTLVTGGLMAAIKGTLKNGTIILDRPADWPDGSRVRVEPLEEEQSLGVRDEDWPNDPEGIAKLLARMDRVEPFEMTPEEEAELVAWRQKVKEPRWGRPHEAAKGGSESHEETGRRRTE